MANVFIDATPEEVKNAKGLHLLTHATANGMKIHIFLEELKEAYGLGFGYTNIDIKAGTQKEEWFLRLNPNGRIPLLLDATQDPPFPVMESSAILLYLAEHYDKQAKFHFTSPLEKSELEQWLFFWHGSAQPYQGNFIYFSRILPEKCDIAIERFRKETLRVYEVLEIRLSGRYTSEPRDYLVGAGKGKYSIADISAFPWVVGATYSGFTEEEIAPFPHLAQWRERIVQRSAAQLGIDQEWHLK